MVRSGEVLRRMLLASSILVLGVAIMVIAGADRSSAQVKVYHHSNRTWLGVSVQDLTEKLAESMNLDVQEGALVNEVFDDSPADEAGIQERDVIVEFNERDIDDADDLVRAVRKSEQGKTVEIAVVRDGKEVKLQATLKKRFRDRYSYRVRPRMLQIPRLFTGSELAGMELQELNKQLGEYFGAPNGRGVLVTEVEEDSPAAEAGFRAGDVIVKVEEERVKDVEDIWDGFEDVDEGEKVKFELMRKGQRLTLELELDEADNFSSEHFEFWFPEHSGSFTVPHLPDDELHQYQEGMERFQEEMERLQEGLQDMMEEFQEKFQNGVQKLQHEVKELLEV